MQVWILVREFLPFDLRPDHESVHGPSYPGFLDGLGLALRAHFRPRKPRPRLVVNRHCFRVTVTLKIALKPVLVVPSIIVHIAPYLRVLRLRQGLGAGEVLVRRGEGVVPLRGQVKGILLGVHQGGGGVRRRHTRYVVGMRSVLRRRSRLLQHPAKKNTCSEQIFITERNKTAYKPRRLLINELPFLSFPKRRQKSKFLFLVRVIK